MYNDVGVAIRWLLDRGVQRVAYVDVDAHHGDGVQAMFYDDPRVLTISLHESGRTLFPGTGWPGDIGGPGAQGTAVNVALPAGTADNQWLRAFNAVVPPVLEEFDPEFLVSQHGCDSHFEDAMAHLLLSVDGQRASYSAVHRLAHRLAGGRWVAVGGGGYEVVDVVPRAWTHLIAEALHRPIAPETPTPEAFRVFVLDLLGPGRPGPDDRRQRPVGAALRAQLPPGGPPGPGDHGHPAGGVPALGPGRRPVRGVLRPRLAAPAGPGASGAVARSHPFAPGRAGVG